MHPVVTRDLSFTRGLRATKSFHDTPPPIIHFTLTAALGGRQLWTYHPHLCLRSLGETREKSTILGKRGGRIRVCRKEARESRNKKKIGEEDSNRQEDVSKPQPW